MARKKLPPLDSKYVPYITGEVSEQARKYLPADSETPLTTTMVADFTRAARKDAELRLAVLKVLRAHATNGGEVPLAGFALTISGVAVLVAGLNTYWIVGLVVGLVVVIAVASILNFSLAAHSRKVIAVVWLRAYEDALSQRRWWR